MRTIAQLGGRVIRLYTPTIMGGNQDKYIDACKNNPHSCDYFYYDTAQHKFVTNETLFKSLDMVLNEAQKYGIRVIIRLINALPDWGGISNFCRLAFNNLNCDANNGATINYRERFYSNTDIIKAFENQIVYPIVNRYKNNPVILAWETGNELNEWYWYQNK